MVAMWLFWVGETFGNKSFFVVYWVIYLRNKFNWILINLNTFYSGYVARLFEYKHRFQTDTYLIIKLWNRKVMKLTVNCNSRGLL